MSGNKSDWPPGHAIIKSIGWETTGDGREFIAVLTFPNGPPKNLMFGAVWNKTPVLLVEVDQLNGVR